MTKPLRVAGEVDSWCTSCELILNHRIVSMVGTKPEQVECLTCRKSHRFRPFAPGQKPPAGSKTSPVGAGAAAKASASKAARASVSSRAEQALRDRTISWEKAIAGKGVADFTPYRVSSTFSEGELVRHTRFGDGVVARIVDPKKIEVLFKDESKTLAQGLVD